MSQLTPIQWSDSSVNPTFGCPGCELFPRPARIIQEINSEGKAFVTTIDSRAILKDLINEAYQKIETPGPGHINAVTTTNIWHARHLFSEKIAESYGTNAGRVVLATIRKSLKCYAAKLHLNRGYNLFRPERKIKKGYAPTFEQVTNFAGRMADAACWKDLRGSSNPKTPWKKGLPRMVFISDMGDSHFSKSQRQHEFLEREVIAAVLSEKGARHLWFWLTKRPLNMGVFAEHVGGLPPNMCAMTTVTGVETLHRVDELREVDAASRGLSIEPLWERIPPEDLDLRGIDWIVVGGESGSGDVCKPFHVEWALELREHCRKSGVAFFLKQLGRNPVVAGKPIRLSDPHGGDWDEWPRHLRVREFPKYFHQYRADEGNANAGLRPA